MPSQVKACVERGACSAEAEGPDSQFRSGDEMKETAGEEFRDGWT